MADPKFVDPFAGQNDEEIEIDLTDVKSQFKIDPGQYEGYVVAFDRESSNAGNPMYVWTFRLTGKQLKEGGFVSADVAGKEFKTFTALTPNAMWKVAEVTEALGIGAQGSVAKFSKSAIMGLMAVLDIEDQEYKGKMNSSIATVLAHPTGAGSRVQPAGVPG